MDRRQFLSIAGLASLAATGIAPSFGEEPVFDPAKRLAAKAFFRVDDNGEPIKESLDAAIAIAHRALKQHVPGEYWDRVYVRRENVVPGVDALVWIYMPKGEPL